MARHSFACEPHATFVLGNGEDQQTSGVTIMAKRKQTIQRQAQKKKDAQKVKAADKAAKRTE